MSVLSQPTPQISVGPPPTLTYQVSVTNGQAYTLTVFQTLNGTNTVVVSPTSYTGTGSLQTYTFTSPVTSYSYYTSVLIGVTTTNSPSVLYYSPYQGPQGVQGNPGTVGGQGPIGPVGPQGPQGLQGVVSVTNYVTCNSLITSGTSSGTVNANANLTFNGSTLNVTGNVITSTTTSNQIGNVTLSNGRAAAALTNTVTSATAIVSPLAAVNGGDNNATAPQLELQYRTGGTTHYISSRHNQGGANNACNAIDFWLYSSSGGNAGSSTTPGTGNVNTMSVTAAGVGINCNAPSYALDVKGSINTASQFVANVDATNTNPLSLANNAASGSLLQILQTGTAGGWLNNCVAGDTSIRSFGKLLLAAGSTSGTGILNASIILGNSNYCVGIGSNVNPSSTLDVVGTTRLTTASSLASTAPDGGANHGLMLVSTKAPDSGKTAYSMALGVDSGTGYGYINAAGNTALQPILLQSRGGGVGIGLTTAPGYALDVNGSINSTGSIYVRGTNYLITYGGTSGYTYMNTDTNGYGYMRAAGSYLFMGAGGTSTLAVTNNAMSINTGAAPSYTLDVGGQIRIYETTGTNVVAGTANTMPTTAIAGKTSGSLTLYHNNANGHSSILFPSKTNDGGDYGYITFMDDVSNRAGSEESRLLIGCDNDYATDHVILQPFGGRVGVGNMLPEYKLHVAGNARLANFVFNDDRLSLNYSDTDTGFDWISDGVFRIINNESETLRISPGGIDMYNHDISGVKDINNTNVYATGGLFSGTTAGRLVMIGVQSGCYIEAGLDSTTGSAVPLYFTDMNNSNQWMCIGSTGNVGINNNSPVGRFHVKTSGNALDTFLGWDSTWMVVTPAANAATATNTPGLGLGYSVASNTAYVTALAPNDKWKNLNLDGSNINLSPHDGGVNVNGSLSVFGGSHYIRGLTQVVADGGSVVATTPSGAATYPTNAFCVKAQTRLPDTTYSISNVFSVTTYVYSTSYTSNSIFMAINPTHYMIVTAWQDNGNWFSGSLLYTHLGGYSNAGSFVGNLSIGGAGAGIKFTNMTSGSGFRCTMIAVSAGMS